MRAGYIQTALKGKGKQVAIRHGQPTVVLGERINPAGKGKRASALVTGGLEILSGVRIVAFEARTVRSSHKQVQQPLPVSGVPQSGTRAKMKGER
jgi:hypothetical protein